MKTANILTDKYLYGKDKEQFLTEEELDMLETIKRVLIMRLIENSVSIKGSDFSDTTIERLYSIRKAIDFWENV